MSGKRGAGMLCKVCGDKASGRHYGVDSCDGCRGFFKRSVRSPQEYVCRGSKNCIVDAGRRNQCQYCRFEKCKAVKMNRNAVQHARAPRSPKGAVTAGSKATHNASVPNAVQYFSSVFPLTLADPHIPKLTMDPRLAIDPRLLMDPRLTMTDLTSSHALFKPTLLPVSIVSSQRIPHALLSPFTKPGRSKDSSLSPHSVSSLPSYTDTKDTANGSYSTSGSAQHEACKPKTAIIPLESGAPLSSQYPVSFESLCIGLLHATVKWLKEVPALNILPTKDRQILVEKSWCPLLILGAAQIQLPIDINAVVGRCSNLDAAEKAFTRDQLSRVRSYLHTLRGMNIDTEEFASMKAICMFQPAVDGLSQRVLVARLQQEAHATLANRTPDISSLMHIHNCLTLLSHILAVPTSVIESALFTDIEGGSVRHFVSTLYNAAT